MSVYTNDMVEEIENAKEGIMEIDVKEMKGMMKRRGKVSMEWLLKLYEARGDEKRDVRVESPVRKRVKVSVGQLRITDMYLREGEEGKEMRKAEVKRKKRRKRKKRPEGSQWG
jgi:hypothetical protein